MQNSWHEVVRCVELLNSSDGLITIGLAYTDMFAILRTQAIVFAQKSTWANSKSKLFATLVPTSVRRTNSKQMKQFGTLSHPSMSIDRIGE